MWYFFILEYSWSQCEWRIPTYWSCLWTFHTWLYKSVLFLIDRITSAMSTSSNHTLSRSPTPDHLTPPDSHLHLWVKGQRSHTLKPPKSPSKGSLKSPSKSPSFLRRAMGHSQDNKILERQKAAMPITFGSTPMIQMDQCIVSSKSHIPMSPVGRRRLVLKVINRSWPTTTSVEDPGANHAKR